jgi:hypothetical protein
LFDGLVLLPVGLSGIEGPPGAWLAVLAFGAWHGLNPAMGWPLAVANGLSERRDGAVFSTMLPLAAGHLAAMAVVLVPFALLAWYVDWSWAVRLGAALLVMLFGIWRWFDARHPRMLARVPPTRLAWWSFLMATAHGAGLMLLPVALNLCAAANAVAGGDPWTTVFAVALLHSAAMLICGVVLAWLVYRWLGLRFITRSWFNMDRVWALSLMLSGAVGTTLAVAAAR